MYLIFLHNYRRKYKEDYDLCKVMKVFLDNKNFNDILTVKPHYSREKIKKS